MPDDTARHSQERPSATTRRSVLGAVGGGAILPSANVLGDVDPTRTVRIPKVLDRTGENVLEWETVPESWWNHVRRVRDVTERAQERFLDRSGVRSVGYGLGDETVGGKRGFQIVVGLDPEAGRPSLPSTFHDIEVRSRESSPTLLGESDGHCSNLKRFDPAPAGVTLEGDPVDEIGGTGAVKVDSDAGRAGMLTAHHLFQCLGNAGGEPAYQCGQKVGEVGQNDTKTDFAVVKGDAPFDDQIKEEDATRWDVSGFYTKSGIDSLISDIEVVYRTGVGYGTDDGPVRENGLKCSETTLDSCPCSLTFEGEGVRVEIDSADGDSGGPAYGIETFSGEKYAVIINHVSAGDEKWDSYTCGDNDDCGFESTTINAYAEFFGTAFHYLNSEYNVDIYA